MTDAEFREAYQRNKDVLYRFARRMSRSSSEAEDIVQDAFLELWRNASRFNPNRGSLRSFLIGVTSNLIRRRLRSDRRYDELEKDNTRCGPIASPAGLERAEAIARAVAALPPQQRETLILAEYEEMSSRRNWMRDSRDSAGGEVASPPGARESKAHAGASVGNERCSSWNQRTILN